jgi:hypothetical protein
MQFFQSGHRVYIAALARTMVGIVFFMAAADSRWPRLMRGLGAIVVLLGLLTPISAHPLPTVVLGWFGDDFVRPWAFSSIVLGFVIIAAVAPPRAFDD